MSSCHTSLKAELKGKTEAKGCFEMNTELATANQVARALMHGQQTSYEPPKRVPHRSVQARHYAARCKRIVTYVAERYDVPVKLVMGSSHEKQFVDPRHVSMFLCRELLQLSLPVIGAVFGGRDHSTVHYALRKIQRSKSDGLAEFLDECREALKDGATPARPRSASEVYVPGPVEATDAA